MSTKAFNYPAYVLLITLLCFLHTNSNTLHLPSGEVGLRSFLVFKTMAAPRSASPDESSGWARNAESDTPTMRKGLHRRGNQMPMGCLRAHRNTRLRRLQSTTLGLRLRLCNACTNTLMEAIVKVSHATPPISELYGPLLASGASSSFSLPAQARRSSCLSRSMYGRWWV